MPSFMNRSCQRQTQVFDLPVRRIDLVGANTVGAREDDRRLPTFLRGVTVPGDRFKSATDGPRDLVAFVRRRIHMATETEESQSGFSLSGKDH